MSRILHVIYDYEALAQYTWQCSQFRNGKVQQRIYLHAHSSH